VVGCGGVVVAVDEVEGESVGGGIVGPGFDEADGAARILAGARGDDGARRAGAHDEDVEGLGHA
jgi:hypothetical protein